jgi:hypothetical protein
MFEGVGDDQCERRNRTESFRQLESRPQRSNPALINRPQTTRSIQSHFLLSRTRRKLMSPHDAEF